MAPNNNPHIRKAVNMIDTVKAYYTGSHAQTNGPYFKDINILSELYIHTDGGSRYSEYYKEGLTFRDLKRFYAKAHSERFGPSGKFHLLITIMPFRGEINDWSDISATVVTAPADDHSAIRAIAGEHEILSGYTLLNEKDESMYIEAEDGVVYVDIIL